jgi:hypothetical protein
MMYGVWAAVILLVAGLLYWFRDELQRGWKDLTSSVNSVMHVSAPSSPSGTPAPHAPHADKDKESDPHALLQDAKHAVGSVVEKVLPSSMHGEQVFNVSSNKYTYYDAEPLCKALGAELATYDQVKQAWSKGADWCNYGWVKGQMAVYPTSQETYDKTQSGPDEDKHQCGQPGVNGGYFDNPELRYGVTCYGKKPTNNLKNSADITRNTPTSPDALAYDKKVASFKQEASTMAILPNNSHSWN